MAQRDPAVDKAREAAEAAGEAARAKAQNLFDTNKHAVISSAGAIAGALRSASSDLEADQQGVARFAQRTADRIEKACEQLGDGDLNTTIRSLEEYARREPAVFLGGAFALGVAAARFLKASRERRHSRDLPVPVSERADSSTSRRPTSFQPAHAEPTH